MRRGVLSKHKRSGDEMMSEMISVASGFQYSVNIGYDLNNDAKLKNFIPTQSALQLLSDVLDSTAVTSTERSRILIGAYGKGKSHIVLMILSMLLKKDLSLFEKPCRRFLRILGCFSLSIITTTARRKYFLLSLREAVQALPKLLL